jgi:hypothetical protein
LIRLPVVQAGAEVAGYERQVPPVSDSFHIALLDCCRRGLRAAALICLVLLAAAGSGRAAAPVSHLRAHGSQSRHRHHARHHRRRHRTKKRRARKPAPAKGKSAGAPAAIPPMTTTPGPSTPSPSTPSPTPNPPPGDPNAISAMNGFTLWGLPSKKWGTQLARMASDGVTVVRSDAPWAVTEPQPYGAAGQTFDFSTLDPWVKALAQHHLTWLPILDDTPWWAKRCVGMCPPMNMDWFATFARAVAARYGAGGTFWTENPSLTYEPVLSFEIWNEENGTQFWSTGPSAAQYAEMYADVRAAIKAVDPTGAVIVGGLGAGDARYFVQGMLAAEPSLRGEIDGFGLHPYETSAAGDVQDVVAFRKMLDSLGEGTAPIEITEFGWQTGAGSQEESRASMIGHVASALSHSNCGIGLLAPYTWIDPQDSPSFGFVDDSGPLPTATAWFAGLHAAAAAPATKFCP